MFHTIWIDTKSGKEREVLDLVVNLVREYKEDRELAYAEVGMIFEEMDVFAIIDTGDDRSIIDFIIDGIGPVDGVLEVKSGELAKMSNPIEPFQGEHFHMEPITGGPTPVYRKVEGHSYYLIYLDVYPSEYRGVYESLGRIDDPNIRFFAITLSGMGEDIVVCLKAQNTFEVWDKVVDRLRQLNGVRDTRSYMVTNVLCL